jgi:hypothetical protein
VYVVFELGVSVYDTVVPDTVGAPRVAPVDELAAVSALSAAVTTEGTLELSVVAIADAVPIVTVPVGPVIAVPGHTRMPAAATVAVSLRLVGVTMNVNVVDAAAPEYVAANELEDTDVARELKFPVEETSALAGVTVPNVTGTVTDEPETSVSPVAKTPKATVVASTAAGIAVVARVVVYPSGAVTVASNCSDPEAGSDDPSVYVSIDTECDAAVYV